MDVSEQAIYRQYTGRTQVPAKQPSEIYTIVGRRGGKSFISSLTAVFVACFSSFKQYLNAGEKAAILVLARDRDQAKIVFSYVSGILHAVPALEAIIDVERADEIELNNGVIIMVKTSDFRAIRGLTVAAAILDEVAFWDSEGISPDHEVLTALRPATSTIPGAKIIAISTPYSQSGSLYEAYKEHYGKEDEHTFVWVAKSRVMNPTLDQAKIDREIERDPDAAAAEWLATFRSDLSAAFSPESLEACTIKGRVELPASPIIEYKAFVDPSGGKADAFMLAIGHEEDGKAIVDVAKAWQPPFDPSVVTSEIAELLKSYGVLNVSGDNYGGEWPQASFRSHGIAYERCEKSKSDLYLALVATTNARNIELLDSRTLFYQLRRLERRRGRSGRDSIDHPARLHDDLANSVAGVSYLLGNAKSQSQREFNAPLHIVKQPLRIVPGDWPLILGLSHGDGVAATVVAQSYGNEIRVLAAFCTEGMSLRQHLEETRAWLAANVPYRLQLMGGYEDNPNVDIRAATYGPAQEVLNGQWAVVTRAWEARLDEMRSALVKAQPYTFKPAVQISPLSTAPLAQALGRGRYFEKSEKKSYHVVNAFTLLLTRLELWKATPKNPRPMRLPPSAMSA